MKQILSNNFECAYQSIDGYCMDKLDLNWERCKGCEKINDCEYCMYDGIKANISFCDNCELKKEK